MLFDHVSAPNKTLATGWLLLILALLLIYLPSLSGPLLFDDFPALVKNNAAQISGAHFEEWRLAALSSKSGPTGRPVAMLSFAANHAVADGWHMAQLKLVNLCIHLAIGIFLFLWARLILPVLGFHRSTDMLALGVAGVWLLSPLHVTTVLYVVQRMAQLATLAAVMGLWVYARYRVQWLQRVPAPAEMAAAALWLLLILLLGTLSKENAILMLWMLAVVEALVFRGLWGGGESAALRRLGQIAALLPLLLMVAYFFLNYDRLMSGYSARDFTLEQRLLSQPRILWQYVGWLSLPTVGSMGFLHDDFQLSDTLLQPPQTLLAILAWPLALILAFTLRKRWPVLLLGLCLFLVGHSMESTFFPLEMVFEHRNYLPGIGVSLVMAWLLLRLGQLAGLSRPALPLILFLIALSLSSWVRASVWGNELQLAASNVDNHPESARSHYLMAQAMLREINRLPEGELTPTQREVLLEEVRQHYARTYELSPGPGLLLSQFVYEQLYGGEEPGEDYWRDRVEESLQHGPLTPTDRNSLLVLLACVERGDCGLPFPEFHETLDQMLQMSPRDPVVLMSKYRLLRHFDESRSERLALLDQTLGIWPGDAALNVYLLGELSGGGFSGEILEVYARWLSADSDRRHQALISNLLQPSDVAPAEAESSD